VPKNGLDLVVIPAMAFVLERKKIVRNYAKDVEIVRRILAAR
jgi:hypothetical protein